MAIEITMPKLSDTMTEGLFASWKKQVGDHIERGDVIAEVETDKSVMDLEAFASGTLLRIMVHGGETVPVGTVLGLIGSAAEFAIENTVPPATVDGATTPGITAEQAVVTPAPLVDVFTDKGHEKSSPLVRRLAREQHIDLSEVSGSGAERRITQEDLAAFSEAHQADNVPPDPVAVATETKMPLDAVTPLPSTMRQAVAAIVSRSWQTIPHFSVTVEIDMEVCHKIVNDLKEWFSPVGYNTMVIKACACTLQNYPLLRWIDPAAPDDINICFAVALPDGVIMPVIRQCQKLSVTSLEIEITRLADKGRAGRLAVDEMAGGSFSVSNLGMYGVDEFTALIMPGQVAILAVGAVRERAVARSGKVEVIPTMRVTLCSDHRSVDGAYAAAFLKELQGILEKPTALLMNKC
jgi:pyruvate dehydrogenase E2 component (dihydrolipoamide acetyltransferase)